MSTPAMEAYYAYRTACEQENLTPHTASMWVIHGRPDHPVGSSSAALSRRDPDIERHLREVMHDDYTNGFME